MSKQGDAMEEAERRLARAFRAARFDDAIAACRDLIMLTPDDATAWFNLGYLLRATRQFEESLSAYGRALAAGLNCPEDAHINRAALLCDHLLRPAEAEAELRAALQANSASVTAWLNLGQLHEDLGQAEGAAADYRAVLNLDPGCGRAHARLSRIVATRDNSASIVEALEPVLARLPKGSDDRSEVAMALGQAYEAAGRYEAALAAYDEANTIAAALAPASARYDAAAVERLVDALQETVRHRPVGSPDAGATAPFRPLFICGVLRSGSTLVERVLARHPRVTAGGELETLPSIVDQMPDYPSSLGRLGADDLAVMRAHYAAEVAARFGTVDVLVDKRLDNFLHVGLIKLLFPTARIINTVRQPDDLVLSVHGNLFGPGVGYAHRIDDIRHWLAQHDRLMGHWQALWPDDILRFDYDELVRDPEQRIRALLDYCGLDWNPDCLDPTGGDRLVQTLSQWQVRSPIHRQSSGRAAPFARWSDARLS